MNPGQLMARTVEFHPEAVEKVRAAWEWYEGKEQLRRHRFHRGGGCRSVEYRRGARAMASIPIWNEAFSVPSVPLLPRVQGPEIVQVLAVAHGRGRPGYWRPRRSTG